MSRILEFQPEDEQMVVSRLLLELHKAIDQHFPNANPGGRQFTKTVLTNRSESTRIDNVVNPDSQSAGFVEQPAAKNTSESKPGRGSNHVSLMHKSTVRGHGDEHLLATDDMRQLIGESKTLRVLRAVLSITLLAGIAFGVWLLYFRDQ
jgi:hypothetical protein